MRTMTRPEFEEYEKRVEDVLARIGDSIGEADLEDFGEVAAATREVVEMRRAYLEITERQSDHDDRPTQPAAMGERYFEKTAEAANDALNEIRIAREALGKIEANEHSILPASAYRGDLDRGLEMAAKLAVQWNNHHVLEAAQLDTELAERIALYEKNWEEHDISYGAGSAGEPIPEITQGDAKLAIFARHGGIVTLNPRLRWKTYVMSNEPNSMFRTKGGRVIRPNSRSKPMARVAPRRPSNR